MRNASIYASSFIASRKGFIPIRRLDKLLQTVILLKVVLYNYITPYTTTHLLPLVGVKKLPLVSLAV